MKASQDSCPSTLGGRTLMLASASPARRATLEAAHIRHQVMVSSVDENAVLASLRKKAGADLDAPQQVQALARAKARDVARRLFESGNPDEITAVVGCDSMFEFAGRVVGKPHTPAVARERLRRMSAHAGSLYTGHCIIDVSDSNANIDNSVCAEDVSCATVFIAPLSDEDIEAYIASGEPLEVAGSFTVDGRGGPFVDRIEGDYHGVVGISLPLVRVLLARLGYSITDFWGI